jgi:hypothetical protein
MVKGPDLTLNVGSNGAHEVDVYSMSRRRGVEIYVDGNRVTPTRLRETTKGTERWEVWVEGIKPCTVRIERPAGQQAALRAYVDGWPVPDARAPTPETRAARPDAPAEGVPEKKSAKERMVRPEQRAGRCVFAGVIVVLVLWGVAIFARNQVNDASIASHGRAANARIVGTSHVDDDDGSSDFVFVWIPACDCPVQLATDNPAAHPKGSTMPVLYDTTDPTNARPLVDGNSTTWGWVEDVFFFGLAGFGLYCAYEFMTPEIDGLRARRAAGKPAPTDTN